MTIYHKNIHENETTIETTSILQICDTVSDWVVKDKNEIVIAIFDKFTTISIYIGENK